MNSKLTIKSNTFATAPSGAGHWYHRKTHSDEWKLVKVEESNVFPGKLKCVELRQGNSPTHASGGFSGQWKKLNATAGFRNI